MPPWISESRNRRSRDLDDEIGHDFELEVEELAAAGMSREEAERAARREFGNVLLIKEDTRETWGWTWIERCGQDLRYAARMLRGSPGSTWMALLSLALATGLTTALFSLVYGLLIAPYPYARADEIWAAPVWNARYPRVSVPLRLSQVREIRESPVFSDAMAFRGEVDLLTGGHPAESVRGILFSGNAFQFLGTPPLLGRTILPSDITATGQAEAVVVLTYKLWQRWFGGNPNALGQTLVVNGRPRTVIGVMPPRFGWWADLWLPLPTDSPDRAVTVHMRPGSGVSRERAEREWQALLLRLWRENPKYFPKEGFATQLRNAIGARASNGMSEALRWLILAGCFVLLIACANVANLQLARATTRSREIAVRMSVGAGRARVLRQLLTESAALSIAGGALGVLLALALIPAIAALLPGFRDLRPDEVRIHANGYTLLFSAAVSLLTGILCGLGPAVLCSRVNLAAALQDGFRTPGSDPGGRRVRNLLVIAQVALSVTPLFGAIITLRGFLMRERDGLGFQPVRILTADLPVPYRRYVTYKGRIALARYVLERVQGIPGVESAAIGNFAGWMSGMSIEGRPGFRAGPVQLGLVSADYTRTLGIPMRAGREVSAEEIARGTRTGLINQTAARRFWADGESPIGARVRLDFLEKQDPSFLAPASTPEVTIVGIVADTRDYAEAGVSGGPVVLVPYTLFTPAIRKLAIRTPGPPMEMLNALRHEVGRIDPELLISSPWSVEEPLGLEIAPARFDLALFGFVAMAGLLLAAAGIYGALHYSVARRTHEIGVRMALGATRRGVLGAIMIQGGRLVLTGLALGILGSVVLVHQADTGVVPKTDALAIAAVVALLMPAALLACYLPARRAVRVDPMAALRHE